MFSPKLTIAYKNVLGPISSIVMLSNINGINSVSPQKLFILATFIMNDSKYENVLHSSSDNVKKYDILILLSATSTMVMQIHFLILTADNIVACLIYLIRKTLSWIKVNLSKWLNESEIRIKVTEYR